MIDFSKLTSEDMQAMIRKNVGEFFTNVAEAFYASEEKKEAEKVDYSEFRLDHLTAHAGIKITLDLPPLPC